MRLVRAVLVSAALAFAALGVSSGAVLAYGKADQPLAQLELSANCTNRNSDYCSPDMFGLGGVWLWIEVDAGGTADVAGAGCHHLPGPGSGGGSIRGEVPWWSFHGTVDELVQAFGPQTLVVGEDPGKDYYVFPEFGFAFPVTTGHYSLQLDKGVFLQAQVAP